MYINGNDQYTRLQKKYRRLKAVVAGLILFIAAGLYCSYDYMVFKVLIAGNYIFTDTLDELYERVLGENVKGYFKDFDRIVISVVTERIREIGGDSYTYLYTPKGYKTSKAIEKEDAAKQEIREISPDEVYIRIPNISADTRKYFLDEKKTLDGYKNITIDLRGNYGGMLSDYYKMAGLFLDEGTTLGYETMRIPFLTRQVKAKGGKYFDFEKITILQDGGTASSAEGFIMALKENLDNVELAGEKTYGKGIGQVTIPLTGGYAVKATIMKLETPDRHTIHGIGIEPDRGM